MCRILIYLRSIYLDSNSIKDLIYAYKLKDILSEDEREQIEDNYYLRFVKNQFSLAGKPEPINATITIRIGKSDIQTIIRKVLDCFTLPVNCRIDFWAIISSISR